MPRFLLRVALSAVAIATCIGATHRVAAASAASSCAAIQAEARRATPEQIIVLFIRSGALRLKPGCAYDLVTPSVRKGRTRAAFAAGTAPIAQYRTQRPGAVRAELFPRVRHSDQVGSWVTLDAPDVPPHTYEIVLRKRQGRWLVDYWARAVGFQ